MNHVSHLVPVAKIIFGIITGTALITTSDDKSNDAALVGVRYFIHDAVVPLASAPLPPQEYQIAGVTPSTIYLNSLLSPPRLLALDHRLRKTCESTIRLDTSIHSFFDRHTIIVDSPRLYLMDGAAPLVACGRVDTPAIDHTLDNSRYFSSALALPGGRILFSLHPDKNKQSPFTLKTYGGEKILDMPPHPGGRFIRDPRSLLIVYVYSGATRFIGMDSCFQLLYNRNTIGNSGLQKPIADFPPGITLTGKTEPDQPWTGCLDENRIFICSGGMSKKETYEHNRPTTVIDVYSAGDGTYTGSFRLPAIREHKIKSFQVFNGTLFVLYEDRIVVYRLDPSKFC